LRADPVEEDDLEYAGDQAERVLAAIALLAERGVKGRRFRLVDDAFFRQELDNEGDVTEIMLVLDEGTHPELELDEDVEIETLVDPAGITVDSVGKRFLRELMERGFVEPA
jgi:hypothetical protein